ncbi:MAG: ATP-grasp domain-containing protein [Candidatus Omnitrophica bacterium]|nr:ATP-grasp domain-containing protein [Candidatus Omnitrophota bacterium]
MVKTVYPKKRSEKKSKIVGLTYDLKTGYLFKEGEPMDANAEFDHPETIEYLENAFRWGGHSVVRIGNLRNLLNTINNLKVDIVFNISEGAKGRNRESEVPNVLEAAGIPYAGSDGLTLGITLDKILAKKIFSFHNVATPRFWETNGKPIPVKFPLNFPVIVKPRCEGSSKGINENSVVTNQKDLKRQVEWVENTYHQPALIEEFIEGKEFTVAVLGNDPPVALPVVQIRINGMLNIGRLYYTFSHVTSNTLDYVCPAEIPAALERELQDLAVRAYKAVECRDFGRVDIRIDKKGNAYVLEVNPLPSLSVEDVFIVLAKRMRVSYNEMINRILGYALRRYNIQRSEN